MYLPFSTEGIRFEVGVNRIKYQKNRAHRAKSTIFGTEVLKANTNDLIRGPTKKRAIYPGMAIFGKNFWISGKSRKIILSDFILQLHGRNKSDQKCHLNNIDYNDQPSRMDRSPSRSRQNFLIRKIQRSDKFDTDI